MSKPVEHATKFRVLALLTPPVIKADEIWGGERAFILLLEGLVRKGIDTYVLTPLSVPLNEYTLKNTYLRKIVINAFNEVDYILKSIVWCWINSHNYDVILLSNNLFCNSFIGCFLKKMLKKPFFVVVHHVPGSQKESSVRNRVKTVSLTEPTIRILISALMWPVIHRALANADSIIVPSYDVSHDLKELGIEKERIHVIHWGIEHEKPQDFYFQLPEKRDLDCVYLGRLMPYKGVFDALYAWKIVVGQSDGACLSIIGTGPLKYKERVGQIVKEEELSENVLIYGYLQDNEVSKILFKSKLLICPSYEEGFCFAIAKAILHGLHVVAYDIPALREIYGSLKCVSFVERGNIKQLANVVVEKLGQYENCADESYELLRRYSWASASNKYFETIISYYNRCLDGNS